MGRYLLCLDTFLSSISIDELFSALLDRVPGTLKGLTNTAMLVLGHSAGVAGTVEVICNEFGTKLCWW